MNIKRCSVKYLSRALILNEHKIDIMGKDRESIKATIIPISFVSPSKIAYKFTYYYK